MSLSSVDQHRTDQARQRATYIMKRYLADHPQSVLTQQVSDQGMSVETAYALLKDVSRDPKTDLSRADLLSMTMSYELDRAKQTNQPLTIGVFDLDHFRELNVELSHVGADQVLRQVADVFRHQIRTSDDVLQAGEIHDIVRWGGEEFVILFPNTSLSAAGIAAERIRQAVGDLTVVGMPTGKGVTMSGGLAMARPKDTWEQLLRRADEQVLVAKQLGRNRIESTNTNANRS